jgi:hypothetical protein
MSEKKERAIRKLAAKILLSANPKPRTYRARVGKYYPQTTTVMGTQVPAGISYKVAEFPVNLYRAAKKFVRHEIKNNPNLLKNAARN